MRHTMLQEIFGIRQFARVAAAASVIAVGSMAVADVTSAPDLSGPTLVPPAPEPAIVAIQAADAPPPTYSDTETHGIEIIPGPSSVAEVNGRSYDDVYRAIPFNHTEYLANPSYRHETTMEILFQQMRPTTMVKNYTPQVIVNDVPSPYQPYIWSHYDGCQYRPPAFRLLNPGCYW